VKKLSRVVAGILERRSFEENARLKNGALVVAQLNLTFSDKRHVRIDITEKRSLRGFRFCEKASPWLLHERQRGK